MADETLKRQQMAAELMAAAVRITDAISDAAVVGDRVTRSGLTFSDGDFTGQTGMEHLTASIVNDFLVELDYTDDTKMAGFFLKEDRSGSPPAISTKIALMRPS